MGNFSIGTEKKYYNNKDEALLVKKLLEITEIEEWFSWYRRAVTWRIFDN